MTNHDAIGVGTLVKWYEMYACDTIVKDAGIGLVLRTYVAPDYIMGEWHVQEYAVERLMYVVHCPKLSDIRTFSARDVVPI
jgi:hypothetical protein